MEQFVVSARKYRPQQFGTVVDQENIVATLKNAILRQQLAHAYLFCGPRGVGKTTCARIFAKTINCLHPTPEMEACGECESCRSFAEGRSYCIHELDAASNNSVDDIRELIDKVRIPPQVGRYSVYIIDEVHMLSQAAFNAFLKTLEEPPAYALFILATTEKHKVLPTILSRCQSFDFNRISIKAMVDHLGNVAQSEGVTIDPQALHVIARKADGALRDALTLLDQCIAVSGKEITYQSVIANLNVLDADYYFRLVDYALAGAFDQMLTLFDEVLSKGFNALHFIGGLSSHWRDLLVCKQPHSLPLLEYGGEMANRYAEQAQRCPLPFLFKALGLCVQAEGSYKSSHNPRLHIELVLIRLSQLLTAAAEPVVAPTPVQAQAQVPAQAQAQAATPPQAQTQAQAATPVQAQASAQTPPQAQPEPQAKKPSIRDLMDRSRKETEHRKALSQTQQEVTSEALQAIMPQFLSIFQKHPAIAQVLAKHPPILPGNNQIQFLVANELQAEWLDRKCGTMLSDFLRERLSNSQITLKFIPEPPTPQEEENTRLKLYMPEQKAKFVMSQYPQMAQLKEDLTLDIS